MVVGQGYVGLPLALKVAKSGYSVLGLETHDRRLKSLRDGSSYIEDVSDEELRDALNSGNYSPTNQFHVVSGAKFVIFCLPTPLDPDNCPDLTILLDAIKNTSSFLSPNSLVISESTSYPGTLRNQIVPLVSSFNNSCLFFAVAPERVDPVNIFYKQEEVPRLVAGTNSEATLLAKKFYESIGYKVVTTSTPEIAEAAKLLENTFRQVNIALVNEFAKLSHAMGINVREVIEAASTKPYGFMKFSPGPGVGGHCIPVDPHYLTWISREHGFEPDLVKLANRINEEMPNYIVNRFIKLFEGKITQKRVLVAGLAYKHGVSDFRESPALKIISILQSLGAHVSWYDPLVKEYLGEESRSLAAPFDGIIMTLPKLDLPLDQWLVDGVKVFDCTGFYGIRAGLTQL